MSLFPKTPLSSSPFTSSTFSLEICDFPPPPEEALKDSFRRVVGDVQSLLTKRSHQQIYQENTLNEFLKEKIAMDVEKLLDEDPIQALFSLILQDNPSQNAVRDRACDAYINKFPQDDKFEKVFAYTRKPHILFSHLLLITEEPEYENSYYEQMLDLFQGTTLQNLFIENPTESQSKIIEEFFKKIEC